MAWHEGAAVPRCEAGSGESTLSGGERSTVHCSNALPAPFKCTARPARRPVDLTLPRSRPHPFLAKHPTRPPPFPRANIARESADASRGGGRLTRNRVQQVQQRPTSR